MIRKALVLLLSLVTALLCGQDRLNGLLQYDIELTGPGYNLIFPDNQSTVYLLDNCGRLVHQWPDDEQFLPGSAVYLMASGDLLKCKRRIQSKNDPIWAGGGGETIEIRSWENNVLWSFTLNDSMQRFHHDVTELPNGNIVAIAWELKDFEECIRAGRDPTQMDQMKLWPDFLVEIDPLSDSIVWEWHVWDHLIQDMDSTKDNFGVVANHPELIDINYDVKNGHPDWLHTNSVDYNSDLDQLLITVPHFDEIWIIDHSTSSEEARGHSGGLAGKGGDLIYRWGNPLTYQRGDLNDRQLFFPHNARWIDGLLEEGQSYYGNISVFNNRFGEDFSVGTIMDVDLDTSTWAYPLDDGRFLPTASMRTIYHPDTSLLYSNSVSSLQLLENGNALFLAGRIGHAFEISPGGEIVWEYKIPLKAGNAVPFHQPLRINDNFTFAMKRYRLDFPAFAGRDLSPGEVLELDGDPDHCLLLTPVEDYRSRFQIYPNPILDHATITAEPPISSREISVFSLQGEVLVRSQLVGGQVDLDLSELSAGIYLISISEGTARKMVKVN